MEMLHLLLPFIGLCAGTGAIAFVTTKTIKSRFTETQNNYKSWISQKGTYKHFKTGKSRIVHVSRSAIALNMMNNNEQIWPTCVVIDEHNQKHQFHEIFMHSPGKLVFDPENENANVYFITNGEISGRNLVNQPSEVDKNQLPSSSSSTIEILQKELETTREIISKQERQINILADEYSEKHNIEFVPGTIQNFVSHIANLEEQLKDYQLKEYQETLAKASEYSQGKEEKEKESVNITKPINPKINIEKQTILSENNKKCTFTKRLKEGEEGYVDKKKQVKCIPIQYVTGNLTGLEKVINVPLKEGDFGYKSNLPWWSC